jgi:hypothetical protein
MIYTYYFRASGSADGPHFFGPWDSQLSAGSEQAGQVPLPRDGTLRNLRVVCTNGVIANNNVSFVVRLNGVFTPLETTIAAGGNAGSDLVNSAPALAGDLLSTGCLGGAASTMPNFANVAVDFETADP